MHGSGGQTSMKHELKDLMYLSTLAVSVYPNPGWGKVKSNGKGGFTFVP
jgi:hypothetical protein